MGAFRNLLGEKFGRLTVIGRAENSSSGRIQWHCVCSCGVHRKVLSGSITGGQTQSCGCLQRDATAAANATRIKHGHARGHKPSPEWHSWKSMHDRCSLPKATGYKHYGARGITVCDQWCGKDGFSRFYEDMGKRPVGTSLDRINNDGNYEPGNCRWASKVQQSNNRRDTPESVIARTAALNAGRKKMWSDPEIRARLLKSRRRK